MSPEENRNSIITLVLFIMVLLCALAIVIAHNHQKKWCAQIPPKSEVYIGKTEDGCIIREIGIKRPRSLDECFIDTFKYVRCPNETKVLGNEYKTSTGSYSKEMDTITK